MSEIGGAIQARKYAKNVLKANKLRSHIAHVMKDHIGRRNAVTKGELFEKTFGSLDNFSDVEIYFLWKRLSQQLNYLRKHTYCFVASERIDGEIFYFVLKDRDDANIYQKKQEAIIRSSIEMVRKAHKNVDEEHWKKVAEGTDIAIGSKTLMVEASDEVQER